MDIASILAFCLLAFFTTVTPGPTVLLALSNGARHGLRCAAAGIAGAVLSDLLLVGTVAFGLGALLNASAFWFGAMKWAGVAYLAYLGWSLLRSRTPSQPNAPAAAKQGLAEPQISSQQLFLKSLLVAITNPKGYLFFAAILPQFVNPAAPMAAQYAVLAVAFAGVDALVMLGYAFLGRQSVQLFANGTGTTLERASGMTMLFLALTVSQLRREVG